MSKVEILNELPKLSRDERYEIRVKLAELDSDGWMDEEDPLSDADRALLEERLAAYEQNPDAGSSWEDVQARIRSGLKE